MKCEKTIVVIWIIVLLSFAGCNCSEEKNSTSLLLLAGQHVCTASSGVCYYIDAASGDDSNAGTGVDTPWKTISKVNSSSFNGGDHILFKRGGSWRETLVPPSSGNAGAKIVFSAYSSGDNPVISGSDVVTAWTFSGTGSIYSADLSAWSEIAGVIVEDSSPLKFVVWNTNFATTAPAMTAGSYTVDYTTKTAYIWTTDSSNPSSHVIEVSRRHYVINIYNKNYILLQNLTVQHASFHGIYVDSGNSIDLTNLIVRYNGGSCLNTGTGLLAGNGIEWTRNSASLTLTDSTIQGNFDSGVSPQQYNDDVNVDGVAISGCSFYDNGMDAIEISIHGPGSGASNNNSYIKNVTVANNVIYKSGDSWSGNRNGSGIHIFNNDGSATSAITGISIKNNSIYSNKSCGIQVDSYGGIMTVERNRIYANTKDGISVADAVDPSSTGLNLHYNLIYNNTEHGLKYIVPNGSGFNLYNNVFYENGNDGTSTFNISLGITGGTCSMFNNISYSSNSMCLFDQAGKVTGANFDNNIFYRSSGVVVYWNLSATYTLAQIANFRTDTSSHGSGDFSDPLFADAAIADFKLNSGSPCLNAGKDVGLTADFAGSVPGNPPEIGAFEY